MGIGARLRLWMWCENGPWLLLVKGGDERTAACRPPSSYVSRPAHAESGAESWEMGRVAESSSASRAHPGDPSSGASAHSGRESGPSGRTGAQLNGNCTRPPTRHAPRVPSGAFSRNGVTWQLAFCTRSHGRRSPLTPLIDHTAQSDGRTGH